MAKFGDFHKYIWIEFLIWFFIICVSIICFRIYGYNKNKELTTYQLFVSDVDGLVVGSPVRFMGVQVGYIDKVKILSNDVYLKVVITNKNLELPKGSIATVEFNGMGGSKSLEIYPPTEESLASNKLIVVKNTTRLSDSLSLLSDMFSKINSITTKITFFAKETGVIDIKNGIDVNGIEMNLNGADKLLKSIRGDKTLK